MLPSLNKYLHQIVTFQFNRNFSIVSLFFAPLFHLLCHKDEIDASFQSQQTLINQQRNRKVNIRIT